MAPPIGAIPQYNSPFFNLPGGRFVYRRTRGENFAGGKIFRAGEQWKVEQLMNEPLQACG